MSPCKLQAKQKSCRTESEKSLNELLSSNILDMVGNRLMSTWPRASVIQNSAVNGGKSDADKVTSMSGNLFIRNDLTSVVS